MQCLSVARLSKKFHRERAQLGSGREEGQVRTRSLCIIEQSSLTPNQDSKLQNWRSDSELSRGQWKGQGYQTGPKPEQSFLLFIAPPTFPMPEIPPVEGHSFRSRTPFGALEFPIKMKITPGKIRYLIQHFQKYIFQARCFLEKQQQQKKLCGRSHLANAHPLTALQALQCQRE